VLTRLAAGLDPNNLPEGAVLQFGGSPMERAEILSFLQSPTVLDAITYVVVGVAAALAVPAVLSATGKIAEAVMERLHPLSQGFSSLVEGKLDVRVEEAGSRDFIQLSRGFNRMTESLSSTMRDLDARNADLSATNQATKRFVPFQFLKLLGKESIREIKLGEHRAVELSVLFCDIRGFTTLAEEIGPEATFRFINRYLAVMEPEIHRRSGFINDFAGDGIMALFHTAPDTAIRAGLGMLDALDGLNAELAKEGAEPISIGIGINTGPLMLGTIGGLDRLSCTVIGDPANLASRVEGMTRLYGSNLLISEGTFRGLTAPEDFAIREVDRVRAKGKREPITIFEVLDGETSSVRKQKEATGDAFSAALVAYREADFEQAKREFLACLVRAPDDGALPVYLQRCDTMICSVPEDWEGVTDLSIK
jgi:adenylate cyclase